jgi:elongation factor G
MRVYQTNEIKNIALLGSAGSGKTTLAESMLFEAGVIKRKGSVEAKNTVSDYFPVELEYGYSVFPTVFHVEWNNKKLNIIDCPGTWFLQKQYATPWPDQTKCFHSSPDQICRCFFCS